MNKAPGREVPAARALPLGLAAAGLFPSAQPCHTAFCNGVDVDIFPLRDVGL